MLRDISPEEAQTNGIFTYHSLMDNGERRYRLSCEDGSSYSRTVAGDAGAWQSSHYHEWVVEYYMVQSGWVVYAALAADQTASFTRVEAGGSFEVKPGVQHNLYLSANSIVHTVKFGEAEGIDWFAAPDLDVLTVSRTEQELQELLS
jgi:hypothetical protein